MDEFLQMLRQAPGMLSAEPAEAPADYEGRVRLYAICYQSDDCRVMGYAACPADPDAPLPCLIYNRGGNREFGYLRPEAVCRFAVRGYVVLGSQYRGNCGGTGREEFGGADVNDVIRLIDMGLALPCCQKGGVYMVGHSRGGMMTCLACARDDRIRAAVLGAGMTDCFMMYETREQSMKDVFHELVGGGPDTHAEAFAARSGTCQAHRIHTPMLICQGTDDWRVVPEMSQKMYEKLQEAGCECRLVIYPGADHSLKGTTFTDDATAWLAAHPLPQAPAPAGSR